MACDYCRHLRRSLAPTLVLISAMLAVACAPAAPLPAPASQASPTATTQATVQAMKNASLGSILADSSGRTVYIFLRDEKNKSKCTGSCLTTWPPVKVSGVPRAGDGLKGELLATIAREDGGTQATYNGMPLYSFAGDGAPGDTKGQGVDGDWFVVSPAGEPVKAPAAPTTSPAGGAGGDYGY